jgi:hypothetical protein
MSIYKNNITPKSVFINIFNNANHNFFIPVVHLEFFEKNRKNYTLLTLNKYKK